MSAPHETMRRRWLRRVGTLLAVLAVLALALLVVSLYVAFQETVRVAQAGPPPPPLAYDQAVYTPERADLCPGEALIYTNTLQIERPAVVWFVASWYDRDHGAPIVPGDKLLYQNFTAPLRLTRRRSNPVPPLPAGRYEMRFAAGEGSSAPAMHTVPFTVRAGCPALAK